VAPLGRRRLAAALAAALAAWPAGAVSLSVDVGPGRVAGQVASFRERRDQGVVKQAHDFSCGAAAFATLLRFGLGEPVTEAELLQEVFADATEAEARLVRNKGLSLLDMQKAARRRGLKAQGFRLAADQLPRLGRPVVVFIRPHGYEHFAVLKGVRGGRAYLADPSQGNWTLPLPRFVELWAGADGKGVILAAERPGTPPLAAGPLAPGDGRPPPLSARTLVEGAWPAGRPSRL